MNVIIIRSNDVTLTIRQHADIAHYEGVSPGCSGCKKLVVGARITATRSTVPEPMVIFEISTQLCKARVEYLVWCFISNRLERIFQRMWVEDNIFCDFITKSDSQPCTRSSHVPDRHRSRGDKRFAGLHHRVRCYASQKSSPHKQGIRFPCKKLPSVRRLQKWRPNMSLLCMTLKIPLFTVEAWNHRLGYFQLTSNQHSLFFEDLLLMSRTMIRLGHRRRLRHKTQRGT